MRHTGHIRERSPGSFELRYSLGTDPATGKRKVATTTVRGSRKDAEKVMALVRAEDPEGAHEDHLAKRRATEPRAERPPPRGGRTNSQSDEQRETYDVYVEDLVDHAFRLVKEMDAEQQEQFIAKLKGYFKW